MRWMCRCTSSSGGRPISTSPDHRSVISSKARIQDRYLFEIAKECLTLAHSGLRRRSRVDHLGRDESRHLEPLQRIIDTGHTPAEEMLEKFHGPWQGSVEPVYEEYAF